MADILRVRGTASSALLDLPTELVQHIIGYLEVVDLVNASGACRALYSACNDDQVWQRLVSRSLPQPVSQPALYGSFRQLFKAHHPHWFLPRHRIWFGDGQPNGKLLLCSFHEGTGAIMAHQVVAVRGHVTVERWEKSPEVIIHDFNPRFGLDLHQPVIRLDSGSTGIDDVQVSYPSERGYGPSSPYSQERLMETFKEAGLYASMMLCRKLPDAAITDQTQVWPPLNFPAEARTRNETNDGFNSVGHRPSRFRDISQSNFRLRKWAEYTGRRPSTRDVYSTANNQMAAALGLAGPYFPTTRMGGGMRVRLPENITTFAALPESCYTPTPQKPYQGIWCGDYSAHGCEFVLFYQPDEKNARPLPSGLDWLQNWFRGGRRYSTDSNASDSSYATAHESAQDDLAFLEAAHRQMAHLSRVDGYEGPPPPVLSPATVPHAFEDQDLTDYPDVPRGRLEAIKLTGDANIPRGEHTFIAPDIGHDGFMRVADEEIFRGARIVRSAGHIAGHGFEEDQYTPSQLILISPDLIAQFWEGFGHISYFRRVDLDNLMRLAVEETG